MTGDLVFPSKENLASLTNLIRLNSLPLAQRRKEIASTRIKYKKYKPRKAVKQSVYFVIVGETVKIGVTSNINARLGALKTGLSRPIDTVYVEQGAGRLSEYELHEKFKTHRLEGEWFILADEIKEYIAACHKGAILKEADQKGQYAV